MTVYLGIDLGTQGCRAMAVREDGAVVSFSHRPLGGEVHGLPPSWSEQDVGSWWPCVREATLAATRPLRERIASVCVDSTSGTVLAMDRRGRPLGNAIMYNDGRAVKEASLASQEGRYLEQKLGYRINPSFAVAKLVWLKGNRRSLFESAERFVHAADYVSGKLVGDWAHTDHTNALKSCFDLLDYRWPDFLRDLGIPPEKMPEVVPPGQAIGQVTAWASRQTGIPEGTTVLAGLTDGCASQIASGAAGLGDWETTLGTTLVIKGVTQDLMKDPEGRIYSHLHPERLWMPGGASNTGGECLRKAFPGVDLEGMDLKAGNMLPTGLVAYPLARKGERFPFVAPAAEGFLIGEAKDEVERYAAYLEGVAYVERMAYDVLHGLGAHLGDAIYTAGGGARSRAWLQVRANVLSKAVLRPAVPEAAMGVAILAASSDLGLGLGQVARRMVRIDVEVHPQEELVPQYLEGYELFRAEVGRRFGVYTSV